MPCIHIQTNQKVSAEEEKSLREKFGEAISLFPGKSESWLMFLLEDDCRICLLYTSHVKISKVEGRKKKWQQIQILFLCRQKQKQPL